MHSQYVRMQGCMLIGNGCGHKHGDDEVGNLAVAVAVVTVMT